MPVTITLGEGTDPNEDEIQYVPIIDNLKLLMSKKDGLHYVQNPHFSEDPDVQGVQADQEPMFWLITIRP